VSSTGRSRSAARSTKRSIGDNVRVVVVDSVVGSVMVDSNVVVVRETVVVVVLFVVEMEMVVVAVVVGWVIAHPNMKMHRIILVRNRLNCFIIFSSLSSTIQFHSITRSI
jgi:hypothetical protein